MRRVLAATVLPLVLAACGDKGPDTAAQYRETVRCYNAASTYAQQFVVAGDEISAGRMQGYANELKGTAFTLGGKLFTPRATVADATQGSNDAAYLHKFYSFSNASMTLTDYGKGEIDHCRLDSALQ